MPTKTPTVTESEVKAIETLGKYLLKKGFINDVNLTVDDCTEIKAISKYDKNPHSFWKHPETLESDMPSDKAIFIAVYSGSLIIATRTTWAVSSLVEIPIDNLGLAKKFIDVLTFTLDPNAGGDD